jgi:sigma-B regulation protein RsbU (phosphoserine phosphatase)
MFTHPFLRLLESLAGQLAQAVKIERERAAKEVERKEKNLALLENARVTRDMELAKQIQLSLLPAFPPEIPFIRVASRCLPAAHVGGDYFDFFRRGENLQDLVIADVSGHSVGAALIMVETRSVLRAQAQTAGSAADILTVVNNLLYEDLTRAELFISMFYITVDLVTLRLTYASAGHNKPLLIRGATGICEELDAEGMILGVKPAVEFEEKSLQLEQGDVLVMYTDGVTEASNAEDELFGVERLSEVISARRGEEPEVILEEIMAAARRFNSGDSFVDDVSLIVVKVA